MGAAPSGGFRRFAQSGVGRAVLIAFSLVVVFVAYALVSPLLAIPAFLVVGLFVPIYLGLKRPRYLALSGLVVVLLVAPLTSAVFTQELLAPVPVAASSPLLPDGGNGSVLQNASVTPFSGETGTNFTWSVSFYPQHLTSSILFPVDRVAYPYLVGAVPGYRSSPSSGNVTSQSFTSVNLSFATAAQAVTFSETGLNPGTNWSVTLNGTLGRSTGTTIVLDERNGSYPYAVSAGDGFVPGVASGNVVVSGTTGVSVTFASATYPVMFHESGLLAGTGWWVSIGSTTVSSTGPAVTFLEGNGSSSFTVGAIAGFTASPSSGLVSVAGAPVTRAITFTSAHQAVSFSETGLPAGTSWSAMFNSSSPSSTNRSIGFPFANGTRGAQGYTIAAVAGYVVHPASGTVTLTGTPQNVNLTFTPNQASVRFTEMGLPVGTNWTVELGGTSVTTRATPTAVLLFVSTCPGATTNNSGLCPAGYAFHTYQINLTGPFLAVARETFPGVHVTANGVWTWQLALAVRDGATGNLSYIYLVGDPTYDSIEGPVVGGFSVIFWAVLGSIYLDDLLFLGLPFYFVLLLYMMFKGRESRRKASGDRPSASIPPSGGAPPSGPPASPRALPSSAPTPAPGGPPAAPELACPNCKAVVYASETTCWKCGSALPSKSSS